MVIEEGRTEEEQQKIDREERLEAIARTTFPEARVSRIGYLQVYITEDLPITIQGRTLNIQSPHLLKDARTLARAYELEGLGEITVKKDYDERPKTIS